MSTATNLTPLEPRMHTHGYNCDCPSCERCGTPVRSTYVVRYRSTWWDWLGVVAIYVVMLVAIVGAASVWFGG